VSHNDTTSCEPVKLHSHRDLDDAGVLRMTRAMEAHLDRMCGLSAITDAQRLRAAMARLACEYPDLHAAVILMGQPKATVRSVGALIGVSGKTVCKRHNRGLDKLRAWCRPKSPPSSNVA